MCKTSIFFLVADSMPTTPSSSTVDGDGITKPHAIVPIEAAQLASLTSLLAQRDVDGTRAGSTFPGGGERKLVAAGARGTIGGRLDPRPRHLAEAGGVPVRLGLRIVVAEVGQRPAPRTPAGKGHGSAEALHRRSARNAGLGVASTYVWHAAGCIVELEVGRNIPPMMAFFSGKRHQLGLHQHRYPCDQLPHLIASVLKVIEDEREQARHIGVEGSDAHLGERCFPNHPSVVRTMADPQKASRPISEHRQPARIPCVADLILQDCVHPETFLQRKKMVARKQNEIRHPDVLSACHKSDVLSKQKHAIVVSI